MKDYYIWRVNECVKVQLYDIASIRFGLYASPAISGEIRYLQSRQFDDEGQLIADSDEFILLDKRTQSYLLRDGDVLFVGKSNRLFATCYRESSGPAIASSIFFILRPDISKVYPEYLSAFLNLPQSKATFQQIGGGTKIFSIRKSELGAFEINLPPLEKQRLIVELAALHQQEMYNLEQQLKYKQQLYTAILSKLANE